MKRQQGGPEGILLIDKAAGWTSHDVVARTRRLAGQRRIGHTGTLDPAATGLLVLCLGRATRLVEYLAGHQKRYTGEIALGARTDTDDAEGRVLEERPVPPISEADLRDLEARSSGDILQVPPVYSAVKVAGERAYAAARKGRPVSLQARRVRVNSFLLAAIAPGRLAIEIECSAGTYVRSIARDIGEALGCGAHLASLRRTRVGPLSVEEAWTLDALAVEIEARGLERALLPADEAMMESRVALLPAPIVTRARDAVVPSGDEKEPLRMYNAEGLFLGVALLDSEGLVKPAKVFDPPAGVPD